MAQRSHYVDQWNERVDDPYEVHPSGGLVLHHDITLNIEDPAIKNQVESPSDSSNINGTWKVLPGGQAPADNTGLSQLSSPSTASFSPGRYFS